MTNRLDIPPESSPVDPRGERLESWKEIASYLGRSVRTVRRWEAISGLPVRRQRHERGSSVFAFTSEIDAWREARSDEINSITPTGPADGTASPVVGASPAGGGRFGIPTALASVAALVVIGAVSWVAYTGLNLRGSAAETAAGAPTADPTNILFTRIDNRTGIQSLSGLVDAALEGRAGHSPSLAVVPRAHVAEALELMRQPRSTVVNRRVGREICLREGGIRALVSTRIEKAGTGYMLSVDVVEPAGGTVVFSESRNIQGEESLAADLQAFSRQVIDRLVAEMDSMSPAPPPAARVTTASLDALQLYTRADDLLEQGEASTAAELLQAAVRADPAFAAAFAQMSRAARLQGVNEAECVSLAKAALDLSDSVSDRERLFIRGNYHRQSGDLQEARATYAALLTLDPENFWGMHDTAEICGRLDPPETCLPYLLRLADMRPSDVRASYEAARAQARVDTAPGRGDAYIERARVALTEGAARRDPETAALIRLFPIQKKWIDGDVAGVIEEEAKVSASFDSWHPAERDRVAENMGRLMFAMGRVSDADDWIRRITDPSIRHEMMAWSLFVREDMPALSEHLARGTSYQQPFTAVLLSVTGHGSQAERMISRLEADGESPSLMKIARGSLAMSEGHPARAAASFQSGLDGLGTSGNSLFFAGSDMLAMIMSEQGNLTGGIRLLEMTSDQKSDAAFLGDGIFWVKCQLRLAQMYREVGRMQDSRDLQDTLLRQLAVAEPGNPILGELQRLQQAG